MKYDGTIGIPQTAVLHKAPEPDRSTREHESFRSNTSDAFHVENTFLWRWFASSDSSEPILEQTSSFKACTPTSQSPQPLLLPQQERLMWNALGRGKLLPDL